MDRTKRLREGTEKAKQDREKALVRLHAYVEVTKNPDAKQKALPNR